MEPATLHLGWDVRSRQAFFSVYISGLSQNCDALVQPYSYAPVSDNLSASIDAVSLALMSIQLNSLELLHMAKQRYAIAIKAISRAIQVHSLCISDETLQSVLLLDLYEKMVHRDPQRSASWMSHIQGAMSLISLRGYGDISSLVPCKLSSRVAITLTISCGVTNSPIPTGLIALRKSLDSSFIGDVKWDFTALLVDIVDLRRKFRNGSLTCITGIAELVRGLESRLHSLDMAMLQFCGIQRISITADHPQVFGHYYDLYPDHFVTQTWNALRMMRLELSRFLRDCTDGLTSDEDNALRSIKEITQQICASAPQFFLPDARPENELPLSPLQKLRCSTLLAPLFFASQLTVDHGMRDWIQRTMLHIAEAGHVMVAKDVVEIMRKQPGTDYWTVYAMTGCYALAA